MECHHLHAHVVDRAQLQRLLHERVGRRLHVDVVEQLLAHEVHGLLRRHHVPHAVARDDCKLILRQQRLHGYLRLGGQRLAREAAVPQALLVLALVLQVAEGARDGEHAVQAALDDPAAHLLDALLLVGARRAVVHREVERVAAAREHAARVAHVGAEERRGRAGLRGGRAHEHHDGRRAARIADVVAAALVQLRVRVDAALGDRRARVRLVKARRVRDVQVQPLAQVLGGLGAVVPVVHCEQRRRHRLGLVRHGGVVLELRGQVVIEHALVLHARALALRLRVPHDDAQHLVARRVGALQLVPLLLPPSLVLVGQRQQLVVVVLRRRHQLAEHVVEILRDRAAAVHVVQRLHIGQVAVVGVAAIAAAATGAAARGRRRRVLVVLHLRDRLADDDDAVDHGRRGARAGLHAARAARGEAREALAALAADDERLGVAALHLLRHHQEIGLAAQRAHAR
mmetsp:Transcript_16716/g.58432  ORF Transcript_16716/g.58432 Transcript_16716/m.58432 type:complete len:457 (+) Transcript_16716:824-2194(+)